MNDLRDELRSKWEEALAAPGGGREWRAVALSRSSPVKLLAGIRDRDGRISVLIETPVQNAPRHRVRFQAEGISLVDERWIKEGLLRFAVTLEREDLREIFEILVVDLISVAEGSPSPEMSIAQIIRRLEAWQACLRVRQRGLTREEQAGLRGELAVVELAAQQTGMPHVVSAWCGPLNGIHDFQGAGIAVEVKATIGISNHVRISRLDQLDSQGLGSLILARVRFQEAPNGATLPDVIGSLRKRIKDGFPNAAVDFEERVMRAGYLDADAELYGSIRAELLDLRAYNVRERFPRLTGATVPPAIVDASYSLDERQLAPFLLDEADFQSALRRMGGVNE